MHASIYTIADQERMAHATNYFAWQCRLVAPELGQRVIEVGCGIGNFTRMLLDRETVLAVDVDPACVERLRQRYSNQLNLHAFVCEPDSAAFSDLARWRPDSCVCLNVLEHIEDDSRAREAMASVLEMGGFRLRTGQRGIFGLGALAPGFLRLPERTGAHRGRQPGARSHGIRARAGRGDRAARAGIPGALRPHRSESVPLPAIQPQRAGRARASHRSPHRKAALRQRRRLLRMVDQRARIPARSSVRTPDPNLRPVR